MAQKQFKIGLSNTDKQNMAQDVYERVLALTFNEYDTTTEYEVGDFVVYNDQLYKCISATSGAWDSSKWQLATLNDLVDDIENAVAFVNDKANVDGNYPTMTVGAADNLTPYDEDSGVDQEQPFLLQGTGCGNGEQQVDTGALGLLKEKRGNTVVVNQNIRPLESTYWQFSSSYGAFNNGVATFTANAKYGNVIPNADNRNCPIKNGHKYLVMAVIKLTTGSTAIFLKLEYDNYSRGYSLSTKDTTLEQLVVGIYEATATSNDGILYVFDNRDSDWDAIQVKNIHCIDLTQWFGSNDNIPAHLLSHPEDFFRYYQGSLAYNEGTLVNANGRYLKTIGRNQWDEEVDSGHGLNDDGTREVTSGFMSNNYIPVIPNETYYLYLGGTDVYLKVAFYDAQNNFIKIVKLTYHNGSHIVVPSNATKMLFSVPGEHSGTTYNHSITISIYYEGESGYDQYYPYEELANIDTGTETLRSAGNVKDSKAPDGTITRRVGTYTFTGEESWVARGNDTKCDYYYLYLNIPTATQDQFINGNLISNKAIAGNSFSGNVPYLIGIDVNTLYVSVPTGINPQSIFTNGTTFNYELAEPTTEQGTTFSENVAIDDFGSMDFGGTNGIPQGASIFYAVDYKAFIDSLYNTLDGDATDIVKESELDSKLATLGYVKLTSVSGYDATKTQVLKNVEGTLTWVTEE